MLSIFACTSAAAQDYTAADVHFMSGMIYHHAQAVLIAGWARATTRARRYAPCVNGSWWAKATRSR